MKIRIMQYTAQLLLLLITGLFWGTWFALSQSIEVFSSSEFIHIGKTIIGNVANTMRIIMPLCIVLMLLCIWFYPKKESFGFYWNLLALTLLLITLYITIAIEVPMDNQIKQWTDLTVPPDWESIRSKWENFHTLRTFVSLASFASFSASIFLCSYPNKEHPSP